MRQRRRVFLPYAVPVPYGFRTVLETGICENQSYLVMEYLEAALEKKDFWECFGRQLAAMHRRILRNGHLAELMALWRTISSLEPEGGRTISGEAGLSFPGLPSDAQFHRAQEYFDTFGRRAIQRLLDHLDEHLTEPVFPSLLHGDLLREIHVTGPMGYAWLIDPAVYVGMCGSRIWQ